MLTRKIVPGKVKYYGNPKKDSVIIPIPEYFECECYEINDLCVFKWNCNTYALVPHYNGICFLPLLSVGTKKDLNYWLPEEIELEPLPFSKQEGEGKLYPVGNFDLKCYQSKRPCNRPECPREECK